MENGGIRILNGTREFRSGPLAVSWEDLFKELSVPQTWKTLNSFLISLEQKPDLVKQILQSLIKEGILLPYSLPSAASAYHSRSSQIEIIEDVDFKSKPLNGQSNRNQKRVGPTSSLTDLLSKRNSTRCFSPYSMSVAKRDHILRSAYGYFGKKRAVPSAGGCFALKLFVVQNPGKLRLYSPEKGSLEPLGRAQTYGDIVGCLKTKHIQYETASAIFVLSGNLEIVGKRYGERGYRYLLLEAGHVAQNLLLAAIEKSLGGVTVGAFDDYLLSKSCGLIAGVELPLYTVVLGKEMEGEENAHR